MALHRRRLLRCALAATLLAGCATLTPPERSVLAPTGTLRVAVYPGSPTSMVRAPGGTEMRGLTVEVGREPGKRLGVPVEVVVFQRVAEVVAAEAAWAVKTLIKPKVVIPMHYGANPLAKGTAEQFVEAMGGGGIRVQVAVPGQPLRY